MRAWFGLTQTELALYLGVSPMRVSHLDGGRRAFSAEVLVALLPLVQQLPPKAELLVALLDAAQAVTLTTVQQGIAVHRATLGS